MIIASIALLPTRLHRHPGVRGSFPPASEGDLDQSGSHPDRHPNKGRARYDEDTSFPNYILVGWHTFTVIASENIKMIKFLNQYKNTVMGRVWYIISLCDILIEIIIYRCNFYFAHYSFQIIVKVCAFFTTQLIFFIVQFGQWRAPSSPSPLFGGASRPNTPALQPTATPLLSSGPPTSSCSVGQTLGQKLQRKHPLTNIQPSAMNFWIPFLKNFLLH